MYYRGAAAAILVYDITSEEYVISFLFKKRSVLVVVIVVGRCVYACVTEIG